MPKTLQPRFNSIRRDKIQNTPLFYAYSYMKLSRIQCFASDCGNQVRQSLSPLHSLAASTQLSDLFLSRIRNLEGGPRRLLRLLGRHGGVREGGGVDIIDMGAASLAAVLFMECTGPGSDSQAPETALACSRCCQHHTHVPRASPPPCAPTQSQLQVCASLWRLSPKQGMAAKRAGSEHPSGED